MDELERLLEKLKDPDAWTRIEAVMALGNVRDVKGVPALIDALKDETWEVRFDAAEALGKIGDARAVPALIDALKDEYEFVRGSVAHALVEIVGEKEMDLSKVQASLLEFVNRKKDPDEREKAKRLAVLAYTNIANAVSERKGKEMPGEMLPARIKPPKKGLYRTRRVVNG